MEEVKLRIAGIEDVPTIAALAKIIWLHYYTSIISEQQITYMLNKMYALSSLEEQINHQKHRFYLIERNKEHIGFIALVPETDSEWFLSKFYIHQVHARKGVGQFVFKQILKSIQPSKVRLTVNRQNFKAINFYFKLGFVIKKVADFDIGEGYFMNDFAMEWESREKSGK